jgi:hypothetical protein
LADGLKLKSWDSGDGWIFPWLTAIKNELDFARLIERKGAGWRLPSHGLAPERSGCDDKQKAKGESAGKSYHGYQFFPVVAGAG